MGRRDKLVEPRMERSQTHPSNELFDSKVIGEVMNDERVKIEKIHIITLHQTNAFAHNIAYYLSSFVLARCNKNDHSYFKSTTKRHAFNNKNFYNQHGQEDTHSAVGASLVHGVFVTWE